MSDARPAMSSKLTAAVCGHQVIDFYEMNGVAVWKDLLVLLVSYPTLTGRARCSGLVRFSRPLL
eukprot:3007064-Rhodomonas_salina.1